MAARQQQRQQTQECPVDTTPRLKIVCDCEHKSCTKNLTFKSRGKKKSRTAWAMLAVKNIG